MLRYRLATVGLVIGALLGLVLVASGIGNLFSDKGEPVPAGTGRMHSPFVDEIPCSRYPDRVCDSYPSVRLDLPNDKTEVLGQEALYDLVRREGPVMVEIEWDSELESATRVRYEGRWYRAGFPADADLFSSLAFLVLGLPLTGLSLLFLVGREPPGGPHASQALAPEIAN